MVRRFAGIVAAIAVAALGMGVAVADNAGAATTSGATAFTLPNVAAGFTPQGMTVWGNRVIVSEYKVGANTRLVAVNPASGKVYGSISIAPTHAGGIAVAGAWVFVQNADTVGSDAVRRYALADVSAAFTRSHANHGHPVFVRAAGVQQLAKWQFASVMTTDATTGELLAGHHGVGAGARLYRYVVGANGSLTARPGYVVIPDNAQGVAVDASGRLVITSGGGHLTVAGVTRAIPSHAEGVAVIAGRAYVAFEGTHAATVRAFTL